jgi:hypothetical protein
MSVECILIEARLERCAVRAGSCMWQDLEGSCTYSDKVHTLEEFCAVTGKALPTETDIEKFKEALAIAVRE